MNINDFKNLELQSGDRLNNIFVRQAELMEKYHKIEDKNGLLQTPDIPVNLHDSKGQARLKDFAWRVTEELGEALEAIRIHPDIPEHYNEELADGLHFLTEMTILSGMVPDILVYNAPKGFSRDRLEKLYAIAKNEYEGVSARVYHALVFRTGKTVEALALTCNTLKNKPWKQSQMITDEAYFRQNLCTSWVRFIQLALCARINSDLLYDLYFRKSEVNKFRQRSNY